MMDIITGRAPPLARAESYLSKGSRELARPGPSLLFVEPFVDPFVEQFISALLGGMPPRTRRMMCTPSGTHAHRMLIGACGPILRPFRSRLQGKSGKIKIGFSSMFFKTHASGKMIQGIIAGLDRARFEVVVFCIKERFSDPYSGVVADRIRNRADTYIELPKPRGIEAMREAVEAEELDILVYGEIGMDPANYALAFARLAPVQVMTHGHASTSGIPNVDYFVSYKPFEAPDAQKFYSERLVTFSDFSPYYKPDVPKDMPSRAKLFRNLKVAVGAETTVFICLQTLFKLTPEFDPIFEAILKRVPDGLILMKAFRSKEVQERLMARLKATVPDVIDRVVMLPGLNAANWNGLLRHADVVLDSYPFGASEPAGIPATPG